MMTFRAIAIVSIAAAIASQSHAAPLLPSGFTQNFNSMGTSGTTPPTDFSIWVGPSGTSNTTWTGTTGIPAAGVAALIATTVGLTASASAYPSVTNNNGFNAPAFTGATPTDTSDRALALSPTTVSGGAIQLSLTNNTGASLNSIDLAYDIERYRVATSANELPGYWLFYSVNGGTTWIEATNFRSTITTVPNTLGTSTVSNTLTFAAPVADTSTFLIRWVDDNAAETSPDAIIGLDNVSVQIPTPGSIALLGIGALGAARRRRS